MTGFVETDGNEMITGNLCQCALQSLCVIFPFPNDLLATMQSSFGTKLRWSIEGKDLRMGELGDG